IGLIRTSLHYLILVFLPSLIKIFVSVTEVEFPQYSVEELVSILKGLIEYSLRPGVLASKLLRIIATAARGDARVGLETIRRGAIRAEERNGRKIALLDVKAASTEANKLRLDYFLSKLNEHQRIIYEILTKEVRLDSG